MRILIQSYSEEKFATSKAAIKLLVDAGIIAQGAR